MPIHNMVGGGSGGVCKFVNIIPSLTQPSTPQLNDIWIKSNIDINEVYFYNSMPTMQTKNLVIGISGQENLYKINIDKNKNHIQLPQTTSPKPKIGETEYFDIFANLLVARYKNDSDVIPLDAYYWNGATWVQFSSSEELIVLRVYSGGNTVVVKASDLSILSTSIVERNLNYADVMKRIFYTTFNYNHCEYDSKLNLLRTINTTNYQDALFEKNGRYYAVKRTGNDVIINDLETNIEQIINVGFTSGDNIVNFNISYDKEYIYIQSYRSGTPSITLAIINIKNINSAMLSKKMSYSGKSSTIEILKNRLVLGKSGGIDIMNLDGSLINSITVPIATMEETDTINSFVHLDKSNNSYWNGQSGFQKFDANGARVYKNTQYSATKLLYIPTWGDRILITQDAKLSLLDNSTGNISKSVNLSFTPHSGLYLG